MELLVGAKNVEGTMVDASHRSVASHLKSQMLQGHLLVSVDNLKVMSSQAKFGLIISSSMMRNRRSPKAFLFILNATLQIQTVH